MSEEAQTTEPEAELAPAAPAATAVAGAPEEESFAALFEGTAKMIKEGDVVEGTVLTADPEFVLIDVGCKSEGRIATWEFADQSGVARIEPGQTVEVLVETMETDDGVIVLSKEKADRLRVWDQLSDAYEQGEVVEGLITGRVKGGLSVGLKGVKAFLPGSQVDLRPVRNLDRIIGEQHKFKIIKFNKRRGNIVLSRRALLETERQSLRERTLEILKEGLVVEGIVKNITDYGAFIDLGGIDGLLHITDMSWGRIAHPSELFQVGDQVRVRVLKYDRDSERVSLGLKQTPARSVDRCRVPLSDRPAHPRVGCLVGRLRCVRGARAGYRGPDPYLGDELDQARQAPVQSRRYQRRGRRDRARRGRGEPQDLARH